MSRLVVVSNRTADPRNSAAGGLAVALGESLQQSGGLWFGWSGKILETTHANMDDPPLHVQRAGRVTLATVDLCRDDYEAYYSGYANGVLWPVFHNRLDLAQFEAGFAAGYHRVNSMFARRLMPLLKPEDIVWVHDYHLIPLAAELRRLGCTNRIGFFLHIPLPPPIILAAIPQCQWLVRCLFSYDLVGFQSERDVGHFARFLATESQVAVEMLSGQRFRAFGRLLQAGAFPVSIDVDEFVALATAREGRDMYQRMRTEYSRRQLLIGVDRLDYSKGLPQRMQAFRMLLDKYPENRSIATLIQIAAPSREDVDAYEDLRHAMDQICGGINGDYGELDWTPIRYLHRNVARKRIAGLYRACRVALVTPLRDGMNLVAKEYIAAQDERDPGVLVLSRFAGAAEQLREALLVNPYDIDGTAEAIRRALSMPPEERIERHRALMMRLRDQDIHWWRKAFLDVLTACETRAVVT
ncbi:trehalose-6-phosphate synthase [Imbroritus primus]|uniref:Trehalose-6-phosphate synthase n=1 Tax=Imbroritus primus TaxID=3058603 RepID=A0ACD3SQD3_9BURK|nr:trehalose-6-phosphate synthase [Burkholderiaceae bacterium PBA]